MKVGEKMTKKIVAIGGGENGRYLEEGKYYPYETEPMDREIIKLTEKEKPNFLFLAHSQAGSLEIQISYFETMKKIYGDKFGCNCQILKSSDLTNHELVKEMTSWADIIYEGGGDTLTMINLWHNTGFDKILYESWLNGKVICGVSAGAVCWFTSCNTDSLIIQNGNSAKLESMNCLNWLNAHVTPHSDEPGRYESTKEQLKDNNLVGLMLSNCSAIEIIDDKYRIITSEVKCHDIDAPYALKGYWLNDKYYEEKIDLSNNFKSLKALLSKEYVKEIIYNSDNLKDSDIDEITVRARGLIINSSNEILMCYSNGLSHYEFPGGHLEKNETIMDGLKREILEETGIEIDDLEIIPLMTIKYYCKNYHNSLKNRLAEINYLIIKTDKTYDNNKTSFTEAEIKENYECRYIKIDRLKDLLIDNKKTTKENNGALDDMLLVWDEYLNNVKK